jgi:hypothetical protein
MEGRFKVKIWDTENNKWYEPINEASRGNLYQLYLSPNGSLFERSSKDGFTHESLFPDRYIKVQCTGLKDKNGKLIYESDIVKRNKDVGVIAYSDLQARLVFNKGSHSYSLSSLESYEIIGNIYESHPELLELKEVKDGR